MATPLSIYRRLPSLGRRARRLLVVGAFAGYPLLQLGYYLLVAPGRLSQAIWAPIAIVLFSISLIGVFAIYGYGQGRIGEARGQVLDERQRALRGQALVTSYGIATTVIGLGIAAVALIALQGPITIGFAEMVPVVIGVGLYLPFLPFASLAWIEPDAPADDEA
jgi:hypothetical protein